MLIDSPDTNVISTTKNLRHNTICLSRCLLGVTSRNQASIAAYWSAFDMMFNNTCSDTSCFPGPMLFPPTTHINGMMDAGTNVCYYKFYITTGGIIRLGLSNLPANDQLCLMNSLGNTLLIAANSRRNNEVINYTATS
jgi:hypothetical protein